MNTSLKAFFAPTTDYREVELRDPVHRFVRWVTIFSIFPAIGFLVPYGIITRRIFPTVGLVAIFLSACSGVLQLVHKAGTRRTSFLMDLTMAVLIALCYIPGIISVRFPEYWGRGTDVIGYTIAGLYGTVPLILNFCIHCFFVLRETYVGDAVGWVFTPTPTCAHCQRHVCSKKNPFSSDISKESYANTNAEAFERGDTQSLSTDVSPGRDEESSHLIPQQEGHSHYSSHMPSSRTILDSPESDLQRMTTANGSTASGWTGVIRWLDDITRKPAPVQSQSNAV